MPDILRQHGGNFSVYTLLQECHKPGTPNGQRAGIGTGTGNQTAAATSSAAGKSGLTAVETLTSAGGSYVHAMTVCGLLISINPMRGC